MAANTAGGKKRAAHVLESVPGWNLRLLSVGVQNLQTRVGTTLNINELCRGTRGELKTGGGGGRGSVTARHNLVVRDTITGSGGRDTRGWQAHSAAAGCV